MKISLLGATGRVGSIILENIVTNEIHVNVLTRDHNRLKINSPYISIVEGDVLNKNVLAEALKGSSLVLSALNTNGTNTLSLATPLIVEEMKNNQIKRIITIGTAGILQARSEPHLYRFQSKESRRKTTLDAEDHLMAYKYLKESSLDWTIVCPTYLPNGERLGKYRIEKDFLPDNASSISIYDTADFAFKQIYEKKFIGYRVGITY